MLNKKDAIRIEKQSRKCGGPRTVYIFLCNVRDCGKEFKCRVGKELSERNGTCAIHSHRKRPFESIYNSILNDWRQTPVELTYDEFLIFTKNNKCHYCHEIINWIEYSTVSGKYISRAYYLDRMDNNVSYSSNNCVVCCTRCNLCRSNSYTYDEWYGMTEYFRNKKEL